MGQVSGGKEVKFKASFAQFHLKVNRMTTATQTVDWPGLSGETVHVLRVQDWYSSQGSPRKLRVREVGKWPVVARIHWRDQRPERKV